MQKEIKTMEKMKKLYEKVAGDSALQAKFEVIMTAAEKAGPEKTGEKLIAFAKETGYEVSIEEAREFFLSLTGQKEGALSDAELDAVAGGKTEPFVPTSMYMTNTQCAIISIKDKLQTDNCEMYLTF